MILLWSTQAAAQLAPIENPRAGTHSKFTFVDQRLGPDQAAHCEWFVYEVKAPCRIEPDGGALWKG